MPIHLTDRVVKALPPPAGGKQDELIFDDRLSCLAVRNCRNGHKIFLVQGRQEDGRQIRRPLGRFGVISTAKARKLAKAWAGRLASGADLHAEAANRKAKSAQRKVDSAYTVSDLTDEWGQAPKKNGVTKRQGYAQASERRLRRTLGALLTKPAASITFDDLTHACDAVDKPAARHAATVQTKTLFRWAKSKRKIPHNPAVDLELPELPVSRDRCLTGEEMQAIWRAVRSFSPPYGVYTRVLQGTCLRRAEAAGALWPQFNEDLSLMSLEGWQMKTGRPHLVPIPHLLRDLLRSLPRFSWSDRVFTADGRRSLSGFGHLKRKIDEALIADGVKLAPWRLHDFRRSAVSWMAGEGIDITVADLLLAHGVSSLSSVGAVYQRFQWLDERRDALERWTSFLAHG